MQKWVKMVLRISGVVMAPVMAERWWRVSRSSWATRSVGIPELIAAMAARVEARALRRA